MFCVLVCLCVMVVLISVICYINYTMTMMMMMMCGGPMGVCRLQASVCVQNQPAGFLPSPPVRPTGLRCCLITVSSSHIHTTDYSKLVVRSADACLLSHITSLSAASITSLLQSLHTYTYVTLHTFINTYSCHHLSKHTMQILHNESQTLEWTVRNYDNYTPPLVWLCPFI